MFAARFIRSPFTQLRSITNQSLSLAYTNPADKEKYYQLVLDSYRLQMDEDYKFQGNPRGIYAWVSAPGKTTTDENYPVNHFAKHLSDLKKRDKLPHWWDDAEDQNILNFSKATLFYTLERSDLMDANGHETQRYLELRKFIHSLQ